MTVAQSSHFTHHEGEIADFSEGELDRLLEFHDRLAWNSLNRLADRRKHMGVFDDDKERGEALLQDRAELLVQGNLSDEAPVTADVARSCAPAVGNRAIYLVNIS